MFNRLKNQWDINDIISHYSEQVDFSIQHLKLLFWDLESNWKYIFQPFHLTENIVQEKKIPASNELPDLSTHKSITLYDHTYWCPSNCTYCGYFTSSPPPNYKTLDHHINLKIKELGVLKKHLSKEVSVSSLYFWWGTPTVLNTNLIEKLIWWYKENFNIQENAEITIEANPITVNKNKLSCLNKLGINRISYWVQSLNKLVLSWCERKYSQQQVEKAVKMAIDYFPHVNTDVIYGLKHQTVDLHMDTLKKIIDMWVNQITAYSLRKKWTSKVHHDYNQWDYKEYPSPIEKIKMYLYTKYFLESAWYIENFVGRFNKDSHQVKIYDERRNQKVPCFGIWSGAYSYSEWRHYNNIMGWWKYENLIENNKLPIENMFKFNEEQKITIALMRKIKSWWPFQLNIDEKNIVKNLIQDNLLIPTKEDNLYTVSTIWRSINEYLIHTLI